MDTPLPVDAVAELKKQMDAELKNQMDAELKKQMDATKEQPGGGEAELQATSSGRGDCQIIILAIPF